MSDARRIHRADGPDGVATDLVEYLIVAVPDLDSLADVVPALAELVEAGVMYILDVVVLTRDSEGAVAVLELEDVGGMAALAEVEGDVGGLLSDSDIEFCAFALRPGTAGIVLVTEDRWARPLAIAARRAGGQIVAGDRVPAARVEARRTSRDHRDDLLIRPPSGEGARRWEAFIVDPAAQLAELADLYTRGLMTRDEFERRKRNLLES